MFFFKFIVLKPSNYSFVLKRLINNQVRVRFAPSPTGFLHLGGLRTAFYNHLFAKSHNGVMILRIEDTDFSRKIPLGAENLIDDLAWCGITFDEGPYFQSDRKEIYQAYAKQLLDQGDAYRCFCSKARLELIKKSSIRERAVPKYDNHCRNLPKHELETCYKNRPYCIRFKLSNYTDTFNDLIHGPTSHNVGAVEGDPVILKSDGLPTYHLANVVDDHLMNITHVLRGAEWLASTTKHILLYRAFKWDPPHFGHLPLLLNEDGSKLSKRQSHTQIRQLRNDGYFPKALINFIIRLGGGFGISSADECKMYSVDELIEKFQISNIKISSCQVDPKLLSFFNNAEILRLFETDTGRKILVKKTQEVVQKKFQDSEHTNSLVIREEHIESILKAMKHRISNLRDLVNDDFSYLWVWSSNWSVDNKVQNELIKDLISKLENVNWDIEELNVFLKNFCKQNFVKYSDFFPTLRFVLTGKKSGPKIGEIMHVLTKENALYRLSKAVEQGLSSTHGHN